MISVKKCLEINEELDKAEEILKDLREDVSKYNKRLDIEEVEKDLDYEATKKLFNKIEYRLQDSRICERLESILEKKKKAEYPEMEGVYYYPELKEITFLAEDKQITLDRLLKETYYGRRRLKCLDEISEDDELIHTLIEKNILTPLYAFPCNCDDSEDECAVDFMDYDVFKKYSTYWNDPSKLTEEEAAEIDYGHWEKGCWNGEGYVVSSMEDFKERRGYVLYEVSKEPDLTLDYI